MANRLYHDPRINIENVATDLEHTFLSQGYQVQHFGNSDHMTVQMRKGGDLATIIGMQTALTATMQRSPRGILTMIGHQKWVDKAVVGAVGRAAGFADHLQLGLPIEPVQRGLLSAPKLWLFLRTFLHPGQRIGV